MDPVVYTTRLSDAPVNLEEFTLILDCHEYLPSEDSQLQLAALLRRMPRLRKLLFQFQPSSAAAAAALGGALQGLTALTFVELGATEGKDYVTPFWAPAVEALIRCSRLQRLKLDWQCASTRWVAAVAATLRALPALTTLNMSNIKMSSTYIHPPDIIDVDGGDADDLPLRAISSALRACTHLSTITIAHSELGTAGATQMCEELQDHPALRKLELRSVCVDTNATSRLRSLVPFVNIS